jgi:hypothetical protein
MALANASWVRNLEMMRSAWFILNRVSAYRDIVKRVSWLARPAICRYALFS